VADIDRKPLRALLALLLVLGLAGAACGDDDDDTATDTTLDETTTTEADAGDQTVDVVAVDYAFEGLPASASAGTRLTLKNESAAEVHEIVAVKLPDSETRPAADLVKLPEAELGALAGGEPAMVLVAPPGQAGFAAVGDGTLAEAGRYLLLCFIPTGADPAEYIAAAQTATDGPPQVAGGPPHFTAGMFGEITVE
jgi:hypothetical protein